MPAAPASPWPIVAALAFVLALAWPPDTGRSLGVKAINWLADPSGQLPRRPEPLALNVDDDADVVTEHDAEEAAYESMSRQSTTARLRLELRDLRDPMDASAERPLLVAIGALGALWAFIRRT